MTGAREQLLTGLRERIVAYAASRVGRDFAEDLAQEVLVVLETKYGYLETVEDLMPVSFQILRFKMQDLRRKQSRRGEFTSLDASVLPLADGAEDQLAALEREELLARLRAALETMDGKCRELFRLKLEGRAFPQIQTLMNAASLNTVYTWDFRCRKLLLEQMTRSGRTP
jgi:RNA polymerase sigma-70 factor, ECF subfamily